MKNFVNGFVAIIFVAAVMGCGYNSAENTNNTAPSGNNSTNRTPGHDPEPNKPSAPAQNAFKIKGTIDDAVQEGNVCDTTKEFSIPGTLEFKFTPKDARSGEYTYSGPFNATGSGPYKINDDGTMKVDGTGCIMGKCATYSHNWTADPIDPATCKAGK